MKVIAFSSDGKYIKLEDSNGAASWYFITDSVKNYMKNINKGDEVEIKASKNRFGKLELQFINVTKKAETMENNQHTSNVKTYSKSPEEQESIKRQAIGHMVSRSLIALQGQVDVNNIKSIIEELYKVYQQIVG